MDLKVKESDDIDQIHQTVDSDQRWNIRNINSIIGGKCLD
jgi:hypothetical protein